MTDAGDVDEALPGYARQSFDHHRLWRRTDPIGGPVELPGVDVELPDPATFGRLPGNPAYPPIRGHSNYLQDPAYATLATDATAAIAVHPDPRGMKGTVTR
jgi:hypothetical protein